MFGKRKVAKWSNVNEITIELRKSHRRERNTPRKTGCHLSISYSDGDLNCFSKSATVFFESLEYDTSGRIRKYRSVSNESFLNTI